VVSRTLRRATLTALHIVLGLALVTVNLAAGALGALRWSRGQPSSAFWPLLRAGQLLVVAEVVLGGVLVAVGEALPRLHLLYGLLPLGVSFIGEQLRAVAAQTVLQARGLEGREAIEALPEAERRELVLEILRRELGVMAATALVVAVLGIRAGGVI